MAGVTNIGAEVKKIAGLLLEKKLDGLIYRAHNLIDLHFEEIVRYIVITCSLSSITHKTEDRNGLDFLYGIDLARPEIVTSEISQPEIHLEDSAFVGEVSITKIDTRLIEKDASNKIDMLWHCVFAELIQKKDKLNYLGIEFLISHYERESEKEENSSMEVDDYLRKAWELIIEKKEKMGELYWVWHDDHNIRWLNTALKRNATSHFSSIFPKLVPSSTASTWDDLNSDTEILMRIRSSWDSIWMNYKDSDGLYKIVHNDLNWMSKLYDYPIIGVKDPPEFYTASLINMAVVLAGKSGNNDWEPRVDPITGYILKKGEWEPEYDYDGINVLNSLRYCLEQHRAVWKLNSDDNFPLDWLYDMVGYQDSDIKEQEKFWEEFGDDFISKINESCPLYPVFMADSYSFY